MLTRRGLVALLALALAAAGACTPRPARHTRAAGSSAPPASPAPATATFPPYPPVRPPGPPYQVLDAAPGRSDRDVAVTPSLSPHGWISVGDVMTVDLRLRNRGRPLTVHAFAGLPDGDLVFSWVSVPKGNVEQVSCGGDPSIPLDEDPHAGRCGPEMGEVDVRLGRGEARTLTWRVRLSEIVCPGYGDRLEDVDVGVGGALRNGRNGYRLFVWVANDPADYAAARRRHPAEPGHVTPACFGHQPAASVDAG